MCFRPPEPDILGLASAGICGILEVDAFLLNHFEGFVRNWVNPDDGEVERGGADGPTGDNVSGELSELTPVARRGGIVCRKKGACGR